MDARYLYFYFFFLLANSSTFAMRLYVKPNDDVTCPDDIEPCLTLKKYTKEPEQYFGMSNTSFIFLPGTHKLNATVHVVNVSNFTLVSYYSQSVNDTANIIIDASNGIKWKYCNNVTVLGLTFIVSGNSVAKLSPGLSFVYTTGSLTHLTIHPDHRVGSVVIFYSVMVMNSVVIDGISNVSGNAIFAVKSAIDFVGENIFSNMVAFRNGGAMVFKDTDVTFSGITWFMKNVQCASGVMGGGAISYS